MASFEGADWLVVIGAVGAAAATVVGAWLTSRRPPRTEESATPMVVQLHDKDRELLLKVKDTLFRCATRFERAAFDLGRALDNNSDHLKRRKDDP